MKYLTLLLLSPIIAFASEVMTPAEHNSVHGYNKNPTLKTKSEQKMHKLHNIAEGAAIKIVKKETNEDVKKIKLTHSGNYLVYKASTQRYNVQVNALDGSVMKSELKN
ncbi:PepSY domain-containing protein [Sulfurimonas sp.]|uniref:PepSY domain-containing protein n=1 Tax=Sulfurimonas sp. TaxID=2022749 RepID=UPI0025D6F91C|nr:PepSY domain-containing protein [Sulfurimonas sp.]